MMGRGSALDRLRGYGGGYGGGYGEPYGRGNYVERPYGANSMIRQRMGGMEYERGYGSAGMGGGYGYGQRSYGDKYSGRPGADGWQRGGSERSWHEREQSGGNARYPWTAQNNRQGM